MSDAGSSGTNPTLSATPTHSQSTTYGLVWQGCTCLVPEARHAGGISTLPADALTVVGLLKQWRITWLSGAALASPKTFPAVLALRA
jgi:hypothetical protein